MRAFSISRERHCTYVTSEGLKSGLRTASFYEDVFYFRRKYDKTIQFKDTKD